MQSQKYRTTVLFPIPPWKPNRYAIISANAQRLHDVLLRLASVLGVREGQLKIAQPGGRLAASLAALVKMTVGRNTAMRSDG